MPKEQQKPFRAQVLPDEYLVNGTADEVPGGLNITAANRVVIYDISWNPTVDIQAIYRSYRLGQTRNVYIYRILAKGISE